MVAAKFKDVEKPNQVRLQVGIRVVNAVANSCLGCEVDHILDAVAFEDGIEL